MKKNAICLTLCIIMVNMFAACQPTPEKEVVVNKADGKFEQALEATPTQNPFPEAVSEEKNPEYPERWEAYYEKYDGKLKVEIDADITVSDAVAYPVARIKPYYVPIEQANKIVETLFGSLDVYNLHLERTKDQLEEMIVQVKADIQNAKNSGDKESEDSLEGTLESLYESLEKAPEKAEASKYNGEYTVFTDGSFQELYLSIREDPYDISTMSFSIHNLINSPYSNGFDSSVEYGQSWMDFYAYNDEDTGKLKYDENSLYSTDEAKSAVVAAAGFLAEIGIENAVLKNIAARAKEEHSKEILSYAMYYTRPFNGVDIPLNVDSGAVHSNPEGDYFDTYNYEQIKVEVKDDKIEGFEWYYMYDTDTILNENIELMPFEEIMANVESQLAVRYAYMEEGSDNMSYAGFGDSENFLYVDEIILTYAVQPIKDEKNQYMLVPVWAFYGGNDYGVGCEMPDGTIREGRYISWGSLLTINAVDGSVLIG